MLFTKVRGPEDFVHHVLDLILAKGADRVDPCPNTLVRATPLKQSCVQAVERYHSGRFFPATQEELLPVSVKKE